ncbi:MAG: RtcB family protein [Chloroflexi bacterium]|nr:RtcB family protein [Chloroflexota bacterium]
MSKVKLNRLDDYRWEIPQDYKPGMRVPGIVFADDDMMETLKTDPALEQVANVACLPGIVKASYAMPDIHWGYGFPIGGVAATTMDEGVISPGGVGFDINCGVRMLRTDMTLGDVKPKMDKLVETLFANIPTGVGAKGRLRLSSDELDEVMMKGARWAIGKGLGDKDDLAVTEEHGVITGGDVSLVSDRARARGAPQLGTLGSGNHFLEVQAVDEIYEPAIVAAMGITEPGQVTVLIHCGSRGLGHQICDDYLKVMDSAQKKYGISLPDRQLACAPLSSQEGQDYLASLACAANFAWANRQIIAHWVRKSFEAVFEKSWGTLGIRQIYDVAHNIAKMEMHEIDGKRMKLCVHRKGATRSFPPHSRFIPERYAEIGQPVLVPGDMGRYSFIGVGTPEAMGLSFGSACHGAGRQQSRGQSKRELKGHDLAKELREQGVVVKAMTRVGLLEEASSAYKDVAKVMRVAHKAGLVKRVARMRPLGVIKG